MNNILIIGAGRSAYYLIDYLAKQVPEEGWQITVIDANPTNLEQTAGAFKRITTRVLNLDNAGERREVIANHDVVLSLAPPVYHEAVARDCLETGRHLLMASYLTPAIEAMHEQAQEQGLLFLTELGLDPGLDHLSAQQAIDDLKTNGATIRGFSSYTGGLVAPESDDNPWHYKISWNPMNVVKAGQQGAQFYQDGKAKVVPYQQLFKRTTPITIPEYGTLDGYFNRNALAYAHRYGIPEAETVIRGTLRQPGFCSSWDLLVQTGLTDHNNKLDLQGLRLCDFTEIFLPESTEQQQSLSARWAGLLNISPEHEDFQRLEWLGLTSTDPVPLEHGTPAEVLKTLLVQKIGMSEQDRDMILMVHYFDFEINGETRTRKSYLTLEGKSQQKTAMAKTVGLPLGISAQMLMKGQFDIRGVHLPMKADIYEPVLEELKRHGIIFREVDYEVET